MANKGLRNFNNFLNHNFTLGEHFYNLNILNDTYLRIPVLTKDKTCPLDISLIYNSDNVILPLNFGRGFKPSFYFKISKTGNIFTITFCDNFVLKYTLNTSNGVYLNKFDNSFIRLINENNKNYIVLHSSDDDRYYFEIDGNGDVSERWCCPCKINDRYNNETTLTFNDSNNKLTINMYKYYLIEFCFDSNNFMSQINIINKSLNIMVRRFCLTQTSNNVTSIYRNAQNDENIDYITITYLINKINSINSYPYNDSISFYLTLSSDVINDSKNKSVLTINKENKTVTITNERNEINEYYFDANGYLCLYKDCHNNFEYFSFDANGHLLKQTKVMKSDDHTDNHINLLINGDFHNAFISPWFSTNSNLYVPTSDSTIPLSLANKYLLLTQENVTEMHGVYQTINVGGYAGDCFTLFGLVKTSIFSTFRIEIDVLNNDILLETIGDSLVSHSTSFLPFVKTFKVNYQYTSLVVRLLTKYSSQSTSLGNFDSSVSITSLHFIRGDLKVNNTYSNDKLIKTIKNNKEVELTYYPQSFTELANIASISSSSFLSTTDNKGNYDEITFNNKYTKINKKDPSGNLIKTITTFSDGYFQHEYQYSQDEGLLVKEIDENNNSIEYEYCNDYLVEKVSAFGKIQKYNFNTKRLNESISFNNGNSEILKHGFGYSNNYSLDHISLLINNNNGNEVERCRYLYTYNTNNLLSSVIYNGTYPFTIESYEYEVNSSSFPRYLKRKKYSNNSYYDFAFSNDGNELLSVSYLGEVLYQYNYDFLKRLVSVNNIELSVTTFYEYDKFNNLKTLSSNGFTSTYNYNYQELVSLKHFQSSANSFVYSFGSEHDTFIEQKNLIHELEKIEGVYVLTLCRYIDYKNDGIVEPSISTNIYNYGGSEVEILSGNSGSVAPIFNSDFYPFNCLDIQNTQSLYNQYFNIDLSSKGPLQKVSLGFFITDTGIYDKALFYLTFVGCNDYLTFGVDENRQLYFSFHNNGSDSPSLKQVTSCIIDEDLQHVNINFSFSPFEITIKTKGVPITYTYSFNLNSDTFNLWQFENRVDHHIYSTTFAYLAFPYICLNNEYISEDNINKIKHIVSLLRKDINMYEQENEIIYKTSSILKDNSSYNIFPLNGTFDSLNGKGLFYKKNDNLIPPFAYNDLIKQKVYMPLEGNCVYYDPSISNSGSIILDFYNFTDNSGVICDLSNDRENSFIKAFVESGVLKIKTNLTTAVINPSGSLLPGWNKLMIAYKYQAASGILLSRVFLSVILNGTINSYTYIRADSLSKVYLSLGSDFANQAHFDGLLANLMTTSNYISSISTYNNALAVLKNKLSFLTYKDITDRITKDIICQDGVNLFTKQYGYNDSFAVSGRKGTIPISLNITTQNKVCNSHYSLNSFNLASDYFTTNYTFNTNQRYTYDNRNRILVVRALSNGNPTGVQYSYSYDDNNNILSINGNDDTFEYYDGNRISRYNDTYFYYNSNDPFLIEYIEKEDGNGNVIESTHLSYMGRRLISYQNDTYNITYHYDHTGKRIRKVVNDVIKEYFYEGDKLIASKKNNDLVYYFYDNNSIAGFIYNNNYYFYVKDILGTIREVIDKDGVVKCAYNYTPFGKLINTSGDSTLLDINDILFKGYVYDKETELYWVSSRYYSPELCRWISPDSIEYLNPESINGLNLYAYCGNDPINKYDPTGHFAITLTTLLIGGLITGAIGAGIGLGTAIYKDVKEDGVWFNGDWTDYVGRTLGGFVAGFGVGICTVLGAGVGAAALGGTTATLFTSTGLTLSLGSAIGIGSGVAFATGMAGYAVRTGISRSEDFKVQNMFIEGGFKAVSGALSVLGGYLGGMAGVHNTVFTKLLSQKGDFWLRLLVENVFTAGFKLINALIKPYFMI